MKKCSKCKIIKNVNEFTKDKSKLNGLCSACKMCHKKYRTANKDKNIEYLKKWKLANPESSESARIRAKKWYIKNSEQRKKAMSIYRNVNKDKCNFWASLYNAAKIKATPRWLTEKQLKEIQLFYTEASQFSWLSDGGLHVDHIVPLRGKIVCGLHVPWNLQIIPASENIKKSNTYEF